ncbi:helix-turn-helix transcriptional regulator [Streptomyces shenzhenensis]
MPRSAAPTPLATSGRRTQARGHYQEAARHAERLDSVRLRIDAERDPRTVGVRRPSASFTGSESLTGSERRVAELAARGHTNTEISHLLQVTRRTVESHLTRSYTKLGINAAGTSCGRLCAGWRRTRDTGRLTPGPQPRPASLGLSFRAAPAPAGRVTLPHRVSDICHEAVRGIDFSRPPAGARRRCAGGSHRGACGAAKPWPPGLRRTASPGNSVPRGFRAAGFAKTMPTTKRDHPMMTRHATSDSAPG